MRQAVLWIVNAGRQPAHRLTAPRQAHEDLRIEVHALADSHRIDQREHRRQRVQAKTAHRVANLQRQRVDPYPDVGEIAGVQTTFRHACVVLRITADQCFGVLTRLLQKHRNIAQVMLAVGIDLQRMAETQPRRFSETGHDRAALALVDRQAHQINVLGLRQLLQHGGAGRAAGVVHQHAGQPGCAHGLDNVGHGQLVVEHRNDHARLMHGHLPAQSCRWSTVRFRCCEKRNAAWRVRHRSAGSVSGGRRGAPVAET
ncbi:hypothetical protein ALP75_205193 [Pseudomonas syringae pv. actinidiae]|nr:hypothetical protein ALP75_205193 [Pseudomonas syringae pv. actinidiae]